MGIRLPRTLSFAQTPRETSTGHSVAADWSLKMNGADLLHVAGLLVTSGWCQGTEARSADGVVVGVSDKVAVQWSLLGALQAAALRDDSTRIEDIGLAVAALAELIVNPSLADWNDDPGRTQSGVAQVLTRAEALARDTLSISLN